MAMRIENLPEKSFDQGGPVILAAHFTRSYSSWWNSNEPQVGQSLLKGGDSKAKQADQLLQQVKLLGLQLPEQESSSTQSPGQSCQEMSIGAGANSHDRSLSSESGAENKPFFLFGSSEMVFNGSQADQTRPTIWVSYSPAGDPCFSCLVSGYGPPTLLQGSHMVGVASARLPLPLNFKEDGPVR